MPISAEQWRVSTGLCYTHMPVVSRNIVRCDPWSIFLDLLLFPFTIILQWKSGESQPPHAKDTDVDCFSVVSGAHCCRRKTTDSNHTRTLLAVFLLIIVARLLLRSGNVEQNPGPVDQLTLNDIAHVRLAVWEARTRWEDIGLELNLDPTTLETISIENRGNIQSCLTAMLKVWLKQTAPHPTWSALVEALKKPTVGFSQLAEEIREQYIDPPPGNSEGRESVCTSEVEHSSNQQPMTEETENSSDTSLGASSNILPNDSVSQIGGGIHVHVPHDQASSSTENNSRKEPETTDTKVSRLENEFLRLVRCTYDTLVQNKVDTKLFCAHVSTLGLSLKKEHQDFIDEHLLSVKEGSTLSDLWVRFNKYWDFLNYTLLEHVIENFGSKNLRSQMETYVCDLKEFRKTTHISSFIDCWSKKGISLPETELQEFVLKMNRSWQHTTLEHLEELKRMITHKFFLPSFVLILKKATPGSFVVTWAIPAPIAAALREDIENMGDREFFKERQIDLITINGQECYYSPVKKYATYLKGVYSSKEGKNLAPFKLARIKKRQVDPRTMDSFTRSSTRGGVDNVVYHKFPLTEDKIGKILYSYHKPKLVLIEGAPGVGKTTFSSQFCYKWSQGQVLQEYSLLVLLPLRDNRVISAKTIADLLHHSELKQTVAQEIEKSQGEGIILWLEGLDGLDKDLRTKSSIFFDLIHGTILPKSTIFVTSRPWASEEVVKKLSEETDQHVEILTTSKIQLNRILRGTKLDSTLSKQLVEYTSSNAAIFAAMRTPITADIAVEVFKWSQQTDSPPPTTMTQLYTSFTLKLLTQHLSDKEGWKLQRFSDLSHDVFKQFLSLCELAYNGLLKQQFVFSGFPSEFETLGLMKTAEQLYDDDDHTHQSFNFIHLTLQEYLAAFYISQLPSQEQTTLIHQHHKSSHFKMTLQLLAGITRLAHLTPELTQQLRHKDKLTLFHWLFEASDVSIVTTILGENEIGVESSYSWTPLDFYVTGYCLSLSNCCWKLWLYGCDDDGLKMFCRGVLLNSEAECRGYVSLARFVKMTITAESMRWFVQLPQRVFHGLRTLELSNNKINKEALTLLAKAIPAMTSLNKLSISWTTIGNGGAVELFKSLLVNKTTLRVLDLTDTGIGEDECIVLGELLSSCNLTTLSINKISSDSVSSIMTGLDNNNSLEQLIVWRSQFTLESITPLSSALQQPQCKLKRLGIRSCTVTSEVAIQLAAGLTNNHSLKILNLSSTTIGDDGAVALADMLSVNKHMEHLDVSRCHITSHGAVHLATVLSRDNSTLKTLDISNNAIGPEGAAAFAKLIQENKTLEKLLLHDDDSL